jgi:hypothetical protein
MTTFARRVAGAALLRSRTYEQIEADTASIIQAIAVVLLFSAAAGAGLSGAAGWQPITFGLTAAVALVTWFTWAVITLQIGAHILPEAQTRADLGELMRTIGFAAAPGWFQVLAVVPSVRTPVLIVTSLWMLAAMVVAVRQALDYTSTARALVVCLIGAIVPLAFFFLLEARLG